MRHSAEVDGAAGRALGVDNQSVDHSGTGITIKTPFNSTGSSASVLAARGTQGSLVRPSLNAAVNQPKASSPDRPVHKVVNERITTSVKKFKAGVSRVTRVGDLH